MMKLQLEAALIIIFLASIAKSQDASECIYQDNCEKCLLTDLSCAWCTNPDYGFVRPRCMTQVEMHKTDCGTQNVLWNRMDEMNLTKNESPRDYSRDKSDAIQIQPQKVQIILRKGHTQSFRFKYRPAKNYPLDLYYLMDLTLSMENHKSALIKVGESLATALNSLTENYRLGFGSFVDKPVMPFIMLGKEANPCSPEHKVCAPTYTFWHQMSLSKNVTKFIAKVQEAEISGNLDDLEGGFDALMQILVCDENIGWNEKTRKIVVYASDGRIHMAGDGLLGGIVNKNDKLCHLDADGQYVKWRENDYPSAEEIYRVMTHKKVKVIFAVPTSMYQLYQELHGVMQETTRVGELNVNSSNILDLVNAGYANFVSQAQFSDNAPEHISIEYEMDCGGEKVEKTSENFIRCESIELGKEYELNVKITLLEYPENKENYNQIIRIEEASLSAEEGLELDIKIEESCNCGTDKHIVKSELCNGQGDFKCGECVCNEGWIGRQCKCNLQDHVSYRALENSCRKNGPNSTNDGDYEYFMSPICSDRGDCVCGECFCNSGYSGKFCECNECPVFKGVVCGSGMCQCGECICPDGWAGEGCNCPESNDMCKAPHNSEICSGKGSCDCGECNCDANYFGTFCETRTGFEDNGICSYYEPCVRCMILRKQGKECSNITDVCHDSKNREFLAEFFSDISDANVTCIVRLTTDDDIICEHYFTYRIDHFQQTQIRIVANTCKPVDVASFALYAFGVTVLLGLLSIIVLKLNCVLRDRNEYARFEEEKKMELSSNLSPIYKSPWTEYRVPSFVDEETETEVR